MSLRSKSLDTRPLFQFVMFCRDNVEEREDAEDDAKDEEIKEQRTDEILALESIYGDNFHELVTNRVWIIAVELEQLRVLLEKQNPGAKHSWAKTSVSHGNKSKAKICEFYQKGSCRFGDRCKNWHVLARELEKPEALYKQPEKNLENESGKCPFKIEVRFPEGNKYPWEPPVVAFSCLNNSLPEHTCLNITARLIREAKDLAKDGLPAVFSMISALEDETVIRELLSLPPLHLSLPEPVLTAFQAEEEAERELRFGSMAAAGNQDHVTNKPLHNVDAGYRLRLVTRWIELV